MRLNCIAVAVICTAGAPVLLRLKLINPDNRPYGPGLQLQLEFDCALNNPGAEYNHSTLNSMLTFSPPIGMADMIAH